MFENFLDDLGLMWLNKGYDRHASRVEKQMVEWKQQNTELPTINPFLGQEGLLFAQYPDSEKTKSFQKGSHQHSALSD